MSGAASLLAPWGAGVRAIAEAVGRSPSTVSRELRRNRDPGCGQYRPFTAQRLAARRRACPAPERAPRPDVEYAQHPWVLEFSVVDSPNFQVRNLRTERRAYELALVLNLLLGGSIDRPTNRGRKHWVFTRMADGTPEIGGFEWLHEGYFIPDFVPQTDDFSDVSAWSSLAEVPTDAYYSRRGFDFQSLSVPAAMTDLATRLAGSTAHSGIASSATATTAVPRS